MNERIKQLASQCYELTKPDLNERFNKEKFAELIVLECIAQCNDGDSQYFIAKHFGVEDPKTYLKQGYEE